MDIRVTTTKNRIQAGMINCIKDLSLIDMKDKDVIAYAQVASGTFYKYYADKTAVLKDIEHDLTVQYKKALTADIKDWRTINHSPSKKDLIILVNRYSDHVLSYFIKNNEAIAALISEHGDPAFLASLKQYTFKMIAVTLKYYFQLYQAESTLTKQIRKTRLIVKRFVDCLFTPLILIIEKPEEYTVNDIKHIIAVSFIYSPYQLSQHYL